jgi:hypothetical protein
MSNPETRMAMAGGGGGGDYGLGALADVASAQTQNTRMAGMGAGQQFHTPTMANFRRRHALGNLMEAADVRNADQIREWAGMALNMEREDRRAQQDAMKWNYETGRDARRDAMDERKFGLDVANTQGAMQERADRTDLSKRKFAGQQKHWGAMEKSTRKAAKLAVQGKQEDRAWQEKIEILKGYPTASPQAKQNFLDGDRTLLDKEFAEGGGEGTAMAPRSSITKRASAAGGGKAAAAKDLSGDQVKYHMKSGGYAIDDMDPNAQKAATTAYNEILKENGGDKKAAARAAMQFVAPEKVFDADASRLGANPNMFASLRVTAQGKQIQQAHMAGMESQKLQAAVTEKTITQDEAVAISMQKATKQYGPQFFGSTFQQGPDLVKQAMAKLAAAAEAEDKGGGAMAARAAMQFVAPEKVFDADASRLGANPNMFASLRVTAQGKQIQQAHMAGMESQKLQAAVTEKTITQDEAVAISMQKATKQYGPQFFGSTFQQGPDLVKQAMAKLAAAAEAEDKGGGAMAAPGKGGQAAQPENAEPRRGKRGGKKAKRQQREAEQAAQAEQEQGQQAAPIDPAYAAFLQRRRPRGNYDPITGERRPDAGRRMPGAYMDRPNGNSLQWEPRWSRALPPERYDVAAWRDRKREEIGREFMESDWGG